MLFNYQLWPIPWSLVTADGGMVKTDKAQLIHHLESRAVPCNSNAADNCLYVIYGNALIQSCVHFPKTLWRIGVSNFQLFTKITHRRHRSFCDRLLPGKKHQKFDYDEQIEQKFLNASIVLIGVALTSPVKRKLSVTGTVTDSTSHIMNFF